MKNFIIKEYKSFASAKKAIAQFRRHNTKIVGDVFVHYKNDKRLKAANKFTYAVAIAK